MAESFKYGNGVWATKTGSSMAYNDENGNYKPVPFSVTRDSIATRVNKQGLIEVVGKDKLRIDYTDTSKGVALLEPSRENKYPYSSEINSTRWTLSSGGTGSTPIMNSSTEVAKDGSLTASEWVFNTGSGTSSSDQSNIYYSSISTSVGITYSFSVWVYSSLDNVEIQLRGAGTTYEKFTLSVGWNRITRIADATSTSTIPVIGLRQSVNGTVNNNITVKLWGAQFEQGSYATSYIPTSGSTVTRAADEANGAGNSEVFNDSEGVLYWDCSSLYDDLTNRIISVSQGNQNNTVQLYFDASSNRIRGAVRAVDGTYQCVLNYDISDTTNYIKAAIKYKANDFALWVNGIEIATDTSGNAPTGLSEINFDSGSGSLDFYGKTKRIGYFDAVLTDAELEALTSYTSFTNMANELNLTIK